MMLPKRFFYHQRDTVLGCLWFWHSLPRAQSSIKERCRTRCQVSLLASWPALCHGFLPTPCHPPSTDTILPWAAQGPPQQSPLGTSLRPAAQSTAVCAENGTGLQLNHSQGAASEPLSLLEPWFLPCCNAASRYNALLAVRVRGDRCYKIR